MKAKAIMSPIIVIRSPFYGLLCFFFIVSRNLTSACGCMLTTEIYINSTYFCVD